jgi:hypothetical protein
LSTSLSSSSPLLLSSLLWLSLPFLFFFLHLFQSVYITGKYDSICKLFNKYHLRMYYSHIYYFDTDVQNKEQQAGTISVHVTASPTETYIPLICLWFLWKRCEGSVFAPTTMPRFSFHHVRSISLQNDSSVTQGKGNHKMQGSDWKVDG